MIAIGFLVFYRLLLAVLSSSLVYAVLSQNSNMNNGFALVCGFFIGFILGALELAIFFAIWFDFIDKKKGRQDKPKGALEIQRSCESLEGLLEALPEVIMQSVFYMRAYNDPYLKQRESDIFILVGISIIASLLSITSKYVWIDEFMVKENSKTFIVDEDHMDHERVGRVICCKLYACNVSYGYIIRFIWRLSAVSARFVIFALIWVVLGGRCMCFSTVMLSKQICVWSNQVA